MIVVNGSFFESVEEARVCARTLSFVGMPMRVISFGRQCNDFRFHNVAWSRGAGPWVDYPATVRWLRGGR